MLHLKTDGHSIRWSTDLDAQDIRFVKVKEWFEQGIRQDTFIGLLPVEISFTYTDNPALHD